MAERRQGFSPNRQLRELIPLFSLWAVGLAILGTAGLQTRVPLEQLFIDPASFTGSEWYTGLLSNLGILCWTVAVTTGVGGAWVARKTERPAAARFLLAGAFATGVLLTDDLLQIHALWIPKLGLSKSLAQVVVVFPTLVWLTVFVLDVLRTRWILVVGALGSFAVSLVIDFGFGLVGSAALLVEDGGKFLGVLAWAQYFVLTTKDIANSTIREASARSQPEVAEVVSSAV